MRTLSVCSAMLLVTACAPVKTTAVVPVAPAPAEPAVTAPLAPSRPPSSVAPVPDEPVAPLDPSPDSVPGFRVALPLPPGWKARERSAARGGPMDDLLAAYEHPSFKAIVLAFPAPPDVRPEEDMKELAVRWYENHGSSHIRELAAEGDGRRWHGARRNLTDDASGLVYCELQAYVRLEPELDATVLVVATWFGADDGAVQKELAHALDALVVVPDAP